MDGDVTPTSPARHVEITSSDHSLFALDEGVFDRHAHAGQNVKAGDVADTLHYVTDPRRPSEMVAFLQDGYVFAHTNRGYVKRGDMLMLVVQDVKT